jgi:hypothetical protein
MRMSEDVKINITAETAGVEGQLKGTAAGVATVGATSKAAAPAVSGLAGTIDTLRNSLSTLQKAFGLIAIISLAISWLIKIYEVCKVAYVWFKKLGEASPAEALDRMAASAKEAAQGWKKLNDQMDDNAAKRKALAEDELKKTDSKYAIRSAQIEERRQKHLKGTTDPAVREGINFIADKDQKELASSQKVFNARNALKAVEDDITDAKANREKTFAFVQSVRYTEKPENMSPEQTKAWKTLRDERTDSLETAVGKLTEIDSLLSRLNTARDTAANRLAEAEILKRSVLTQTDRESADLARGRVMDASMVNIERLAAEIKAKAAADVKRTDIDKSAQEKIKAITVDAPIAASSAAAAGGFMGGSMNNAARLSEQREFKRDAIEREKVDLLSKINNKLDD